VLTAVLFTALALSSASGHPAIHGTIRGPHGPASGAVVSVYSLPSEIQLPLAVVTDAHGSFRLALPSFGTYIIKVTGSGSLYESQTVRSTEAEPNVVVTITLRKRSGADEVVVASSMSGPCNTGEVIEFIPRLPVSRSYPPVLVSPPSRAR
jgi:hypothetical protein